MKITAIIAVRDELPENVNRTVAGLARHGVPYKLIEDAPPLGPARRRHEGIMRIRHGAALLCDAHMEFPDGYFEQIAAHLEAHPSDVTVSRKQSVDWKWNDIPGQLYAAAEIQTHIQDPGNQFIPIGAKWRRTDSGDGPVGAVMGACYGVTRDWYDTIGRPLAIPRAWGQDEELLSIASWMRGGRCYLLGGPVRHMYGAPRAKPAPLSRPEAAAVWGNRLATLQATPMSADRRENLVEWLNRTPAMTAMRREIDDSVEKSRGAIERTFAALSNPAMPFADYLEAHCNHQREPTEAEKQYAAGRAAIDAQRRAPAPIPAAVTIIAPPAPPPPPATPAPPCAPASTCCGNTAGNTFRFHYPDGRAAWRCGKCGNGFIERKEVKP